MDLESFSLRILEVLNLLQLAEYLNYEKQNLIFWDENSGLSLKWCQNLARKRRLNKQLKTLGVAINALKSLLNT